LQKRRRRIDVAVIACDAAGVIATIGRAAIVVALCLSIGAHWAALQSVAWATMIVEYAQHDSLAKAVAETFDGHHPCDLCKHISKVKDSEKKQDAQLASLKPDLICTTRAIVLVPPYQFYPFPGATTIASADAAPPPVPPPRSHAV
ncbi:MAG TPA: hypothetical protein VE086_06905, partial [Chthoniobacterales bacterium]|nr:hypothetical protein [Chthoniobacterales bacterium]